MDETNRFDFESAGLSYVTVATLLEEGVISITSGKRPKGGVARNRTGIVSLGGEHIDERLGRIDITKPKFVPIDFLKDEKFNDMKVQVGDLLICKDGARSGKVALATLDSFTENEPMLINEHLLKVRAEENEHKSLVKLAFIFFFSREGRAELDSAIAGTGQGGISVSRFQKIRIPIIEPEKLKSLIHEFDSTTLEQGFSFSDILGQVGNN